MVALLAAHDLDEFMAQAVEADEVHSLPADAQKQVQCHASHTPLGSSLELQLRSAFVI